MTRATVPTGSGLEIDLGAPSPREINIPIDVAEGLARLPCWSGQVRSGAYSYGQRAILGADAIFRRDGNVTLAAQYLLHDAPLAYFGALSPPLVTMLGTPFAEIKGRLLTAIHAAAGVRLPSPDAVRTIADVDSAIAASEMRQLFGRRSEVTPLRMLGHISVMTWPQVADAYIARLGRYAPPRALAPATPARTIGADLLGTTSHTPLKRRSS